MYKLFTIFIALTIALTLEAQELRYNSVEVTAPLRAIKSFSDVDVDFFPRVTLIEAPNVLPEDGPEYNYDRKKVTSSGIRALGDAPTIINKFEGITLTNGTPNDDDIAISNEGKVIMANNGSIGYYDTSGNLLEEISLDAFSEGLELVPGVKLDNRLYDPRVLYDVEADRFILTYLSGNLDSTSAIILAFSKTNDPADDWNIYVISGNPLANRTWSDYPSIGISKQDLFIGYNTFLNGSEDASGFAESTLWQIGKAEGYNGMPELKTKYYFNINQGVGPAYFNLNPVNGAIAPYDPPFYILSNRNKADSSNKFFLFSVSDNLSSGKATLQVAELTTDNYYLKPDEIPQYTIRALPVQRLRTNDSRVQDAIIVDDVIHAVGNSFSHQLSRHTFYHFKYDINSDKDAQIEMVPVDTVEAAYPQVTYVGADAKLTQEVIFTYLYAGSGIMAGNAALYYNDGDYSPMRIVKEGEGTINIQATADNRERWGDYTGAQRWYSRPGHVWMSANFAKVDRPDLVNVNGTYIGHLVTPNVEVGVKQQSITAQELKVYPNPVKQHKYFSIEFTLAESRSVSFSIYNLEGKLIDNIMNDYPKPGRNRFTIRTDDLASGAYLLNVKDVQNGKILATKILIVE